MKILITNDDGVNSEGILALNNAVKDLAETTVVAPAQQQSGVGHAITLMKPLRAIPTKIDENTEAYAVTGTPTDCVILGSKNLMQEEPDLVISGINVGENLARSITTSGTLGATFEAAYFGIPAIAVSLQVKHEELKFKDGVKSIDYSFAEKIVRKLVKKVLEHGMPEGANILNLNIPAHPVSEEIVQVKLANKMYDTDVEKRLDPYGNPYYWIVGGLIMEEDGNTDVHTLRVKNKSTITALSTDMTTCIDLSKWLTD
ncbi:MAG: 5'/3'-nucleotidase SurE [Methanosphaera sp.]|uniref:5'/3'-nucleotidase SurE n=1 Tax=Methanosphaera sp. ISO3-F5 TaxID=1452353 RepID=UPI002B25D66C|nr:5'/3'-nucleotidase SurE [Methanosphaera sp. ISO3-F5]MBR0471603.1 5'/3'-nucleotidase SurE [Methanosphaera sp.]WQH64911.1 5'/3'-nucleotidase SurE [Methanosphaera sp. ISO3-F5]